MSYAVSQRRARVQPVGAGVDAVKARLGVPHDPELAVVEALERAGCRIYRGWGERHYADCPACGRRRKLGFKTLDNGRIWLECFAGCGLDAILEALGLERRDLYALRFEFPELIPGRAWPDRRRYPSAYRVLRAIEAYSASGPEGACPSEQTIADRAGFRGVYNRRSVTRWKRWLREHGYLDWKLEKRAGALWRHCVYRLHVTWTRPLYGALKRLRRGESNRTAELCETGGSLSSGMGREVLDFGSATAWRVRAGPV
jgi:hypothetical protein